MSTGDPPADRRYTLRLQWSCGFAGPGRRVLEPLHNLWSLLSLVSNGEVERERLSHCLLSWQALEQYEPLIVDLFCFNTMFYA